jgi:uncharacterized protein YraI
MKRLALACAFLLATAAGAAARPGIAAATVNLRAEANTTSAVLTKIPAGALLDVGDCTEGWCAVTFRDKSGFAIATALDTTGRARPVVRRRPPVRYYGPDDEYVPVGAYRPYGPAVVYAPGPYYYGG